MALLPLLVALAGSGCVSAVGQADRLFLAGDLVAAEAAYRSYLTGGHAGGSARARARYRLGLIYALPDSELHDWERADRALRSLIANDPDTAWARQAELLLSLTEERARLEREVAAQNDKVCRLLEEVVSLRRAARDADDEVEDREARVAQLSREIAALRKDLGELGDRLAAREQELERIKKIDLQTPP